MLFIRINILLNISRSKWNQTMTFGQFIEYIMRIIFFKNHTENEAGRLVPDIFLYFKKDLCEIK